MNGQRRQLIIHLAALGAVGLFFVCLFGALYTGVCSGWALAEKQYDQSCVSFIQATLLLLASTWCRKEVRRLDVHLPEGEHRP